MDVDPLHQEKALWAWVYLAERDLGNAVAINFLRDAWLSRTRRERLKSEQRLLASLNHPSIAWSTSRGMENGVPWFAAGIFGT